MGKEYTIFNVCPELLICSIYLDKQTLERITLRQALFLPPIGSASRRQSGFEGECVRRFHF